MTKTWKSDGPETKQLEKFFRDGKFNVHTKPSEAQKKNPIFSGFSAAVFRKHFNLAKEKCCDTSSSSYGGGEMTFMDLLSQEEAQQEQEEARAGGGGEQPEKKPRIEKLNAPKYNQAPLIPVVFTDPVTKHEKCLVVVLAYHGVKDFNVDVVTKDKEKEQTLIITYHWPDEMYIANEMFTREDGTMMVEATHPKLLAVDKALQNYRANIEDAPLTTIEVKLPVVVSADPKSWNFEYNKKAGGNVLIFIQLDCVRKDYVI